MLHWSREGANGTPKQKQCLQKVLICYQKWQTWLWNNQQENQKTQSMPRTLENDIFLKIILVNLGIVTFKKEQANMKKDQIKLLEIKNIKVKLSVGIK